MASTNTDGLERDWLGDTAEPKRALGGRPGKDYSGRGNRKLECLSCGFHCRTSALWIRNVGAPSCACGAGPMSVPMDRDLAAIDPEHVTADESAELERAARASIRNEERERSHGFKRGAVPCAVCGRFKARPADVCGQCGDAPATYGATDREERDAMRSYNRGHGYAA